MSDINSKKHFPQCSAFISFMYWDRKERQIAVAFWKLILSDKAQVLSLGEAK